MTQDTPALVLSGDSVTLGNSGTDNERRVSNPVQQVTLLR